MPQYIFIQKLHTPKDIGCEIFASFNVIDWCLLLKMLSENVKIEDSWFELSGESWFLIFRAPPKFWPFSDHNCQIKFSVWNAFSLTIWYSSATAITPVEKEVEGTIHRDKEMIETD